MKTTRCPCYSLDILQYSRHEFNTHFLHHEERKAHAVDPLDSNWHLDGSPHIDHDFLILSMAGELEDGSVPEPGETTKFDLELSTASLFHDGLVGDLYVDMSDDAVADSYKGNRFGDSAEVLSNGEIVLNDNAVIEGDAKGKEIKVNGKGKVKKDKIIIEKSKTFLAVDTPSFLEDLRHFGVDDGETLSLEAGSYQASSVTIKGELLIENDQEPVTLYVEGDVEISGDGIVTVADEDPEKFAIYVQGEHIVRLEGDGVFYGVVYAPESLVEISGEGEFFGAFVGAEVLVSGDAQVHYDEYLKKGRKSSKGSKTSKGSKGGKGSKG